MRKFQKDDRVVAVRLSPNLGAKGSIGTVYTVECRAPKVRVTSGTGAYLLSCVDDAGNRAWFNERDVKPAAEK